MFRFLFSDGCAISTSSALSVSGCICEDARQLAGLNPLTGGVLRLTRPRPCLFFSALPLGVPPYDFLSVFWLVSLVVLLCFPYMLIFAINATVLWIIISRYRYACLSLGGAVRRGGWLALTRSLCPSHRRRARLCARAGGIVID